MPDKKKSVKKNKERSLKIEEKTTKKEEIKNKDVVKIDFFSKLKQAYFHPNKFFNRIENEKDYQPLLRNFVLFYMAFIVVNVFVSYYSGVMNIYQTLLNFIGQVIYSVILIFFGAFITHLGVLIFRGKEGYFNTFKVFSYALIIMVLYSFISLVFYLVVPFDSTALQGIQNAVDPSQIKELYKQYLFQPGAIINILISIIMFLHIFVFLIKGLIKFQKLSQVKATLAILIPWIAFFVLWIFVIILIGLANNSLGTLPY